MPNAEVEVIEFGKGGGFSGAISAYQLDRGGKLYKINPFDKADKEVLNTIDIETTTRLFKTIERENFLRIKVNKPGNVYKYITFHTAGSDLKLVWSGKSDNNKLNLFYAELSGLPSSKE